MAEDNTPDSSSASEAPKTTGLPKVRYRLNALLFALTVLSVFFTQYSDASTLDPHPAYVQAAIFTAGMLGILVVHEFGHYITARLHGVEASLPFFLPMPLISPFGTMGAVIRMNGTIRTRNALLDIGASGPLAGLCIAIPVYIIGVRSSIPTPLNQEGSMQLGNSLLLSMLDHFFAPKVGPGMDIALSPLAFAGWGGMFVTMINLLPLGQLDGGHVAYALIGPKQNRYAITIHRTLLAFFFIAVVGRTLSDFRAGYGLLHVGQNVNASIFWLFWFELLVILGSLTGARKNPEPRALSVRSRLIGVAGLIVMAGLGRTRTSLWFWGAWFVALGVLLAMECVGGVLKHHEVLDHPSTNSEPLSTGRKVVAVVTLLFFIALFMPTPMSM